MWAAWALFVILTLEAHNLANRDFTYSLRVFHRLRPMITFFLLFVKEHLKMKQSAHCRKFANYMKVICKYLLPHERCPEIAGDVLMFILLSYLFTIFQNEIIAYTVP